MALVTSTATSSVKMDVIAAEALMQLEYNLVAANLMYTDKTSDFGSVNGYAVGDTVRIKTRPDYETKEFTSTITEQSVREAYSNFQVEKHYDISIPYTAKEQVLELDSLSAQMIQPAMISMANKLDTYLLSKAWDGQLLYSAAAPLSTTAEAAAVRKACNDAQMPMGGRIGIIDPTLELAMLGASDFSRYDSRAQGGVTALEQGQLSNIMGIDWFSSQNFTSDSDTAGDGAGTTKTTPTGTQNQIGTSTLYLQSGCTGQFEAGDRIQVNNMKRPFIVSTQTVATSTEIPLSRPIDELVPVTESIVTNSDSATYAKRGVVFTPGAFAYATPPLEAAPGAESSVVSANGLSIRATRQYAISTKKTIISFDVLIGAVAYDPRKILVVADS